jgi:hypothetical protein
MTSRIAAVTIGLIAAIAVFLALRLNWLATIASFHLQGSHLASLLTGFLPRLAWSTTAGLSVFGILASLVALIGGAAETTRARARLTALRLDPTLAGSWNAADWRAAFAPTAVAERAEAMIALLPVENGRERRVVVDTHLLTGLASLWLDRSLLSSVIVPLPGLCAAQAIVLALIDYTSAGRWELDLAAGAAGWLLITAFYYLARTLLAPMIGAAVEAATAAIRPLTSVQSFATAPILAAPAGATAVPATGMDSGALAAALERALSGPLDRLAEAANRLSTADAGPSREQTIDAALAEIRAGIERLLDAAGERRD